MPIPGRGNTSLTAALLEALEQDPALRNAVDLVDALERNAPLPNDTSDADRQRAAELLLSLLQPGLLLQLARQLPHPYHLAIGASQERAQVLTDIGKAWPDHPTSIGLCSSLPAASLNGLQAFLKCPTELSVDLQMDESDATDELKPLAEALKRKDLVTWTLRCPDDIHAAGLDQLVGVRAQSLVIDYTETEGDTDKPLRTAFLSLVRQSAASTVDLSDYSLCNAPIEYGLLETPDTWQRITVSAQGMAALPGNTMTTTLEVRSNWYLALDDDFLLQFEYEQFDHLVTDAVVDLRQAISVGNAGWWIESIEACFFLKDGDDIEAMLENWKGTGILSLHHRPQAGRSMDGYTQISTDLAARLAARSQSNRLTAEVDPGSRAFMKSERAVLIKNVVALHLMLDPQRTVNDALEQLRSDGYRQLNPQPSAFKPPSRMQQNWTPFAKKIWCMLEYGASAHAVEIVIATFLRHNPHLALQACQDLIALGYPLRSRSAKEWEAQAANCVRHWPGTKLTLTGVDTQKVLDLIDVPSLVPLPAPTPTSPSAQSQALEIVEPAGVATLLALQKQLIARQRGLIHGPDLDQQTAINFIMMRLNDAQCDMAAERDSVRAAITALLLDLKQGKLLNELQRPMASWNSRGISASDVETVERLSSSCDPKMPFHIRVSGALSIESIERLKSSLTSLASDKLKLTIEPQHVIDASAWRRLAGLVQVLPGCTLILQKAGANDVPVDDLRAFLQHIRGVPLQAFGLSGISGDGALAQTLIDTFHRSNASDLTLIQGSETLASAALLTGKTFQRISISATQDVMNLFMSCEVRVQTLHLLVTDETVEDDQGEEVEDTRCASTIVGSCKDLEKVQIQGSRVDALSFVKALHDQQSVYDAQSVLTTDVPHEEREALILLRRNTSLLSLQLKPRPRELPNGNRDLSQRTIEAMQKVATRNRLMLRLGVGIGAGKGFGWQKGQGLGTTGAFTDVGGKIGGMLDLRSALMLSATSKAAYLGSRQPWESEIRTLADLLAPDVHYNKLVEHLALLISLQILPGPLPPSLPNTGPEAPDQLSRKLLAMDTAGMPPEAIGQAVGLRLPLYMAQQPQTIPYVLRLLAFVGAMPPLQWLSEGMGIHAEDYAGHPADTDIHLYLRRHPIPE